MSFNPEYFFPTLITNITSLNGGVFGTVKGTDVYPAVDVTDVTQSNTGTTKPYQVLQLANYILGTFGYYVYLSVLAASTTDLNATYDNGISGVGATLTNAGTLAAFTLDGQSGALGGRYLIKDQLDETQNGLYILTVVGDSSTAWVLTRAADFNQVANIIYGGIVYVVYGATQDNSYWQDTFIPVVVVGTTDIHWNEFSIVPDQLIWTVITDVSVNAQTNNGYIADRSATPVQVLLPATFNIGDTVIIMGKGAGGWSMVANSGQVIQFGSLVTSVAGSIDSDIQYGNIQVRGLVADTVWEVVSVLGNPTIV